MTVTRSHHGDQPTDAPRAELGWVPRVQRWKIRLLYETEAAGRIDEELLDDVGISLYARCESILKATDAHRGRLDCPYCGARIDDPARDRFRRKGLRAACPRCGWSTVWRSVLAGIQGKELVAGAAEPYFREFLSQYPRAASTSRRMLLIDKLLHEFHSSARFGDVRPAAVNVIGGRLREVMALLDELASTGATPGQVAWRQRSPNSVFGRHIRRASSRDGD